jgi:hypothetical protein
VSPRLTLLVLLTAPWRWRRRPPRPKPSRCPPADAAAASGRAKLAEFNALITAFNSSIQEESKDRKYRFRTKRLMKGHQRAGETLDTRRCRAATL